MKNFLSSLKGKIIAGAVTLLVIAAAVATVILLNTGYRNIRIEDLNGTTKVTSTTGVIDAFKGQNLKSGDNVAVGEKSDLTLALDSDKHVYAKELTKFRLEAFGVSGKDSRTVIYLEKGSILNEIDVKLLQSESYSVESPNALMSVRGTTFTVTVFFDGEGLCHTVVEVSEGVVEVVDKQGKMPVRTLNAGEITEVVSRVEQGNNEIQLPPDNGGNTQPPIFQGNIMKDAEALAVEQAIETYLNGGALDTTNFDRITKLELHGNVAFVALDGYRFGRGISCSTYVYYNTNDLINGKIGLRFYDENFSVVQEIETTRNTLTDLEFIKGMTSLNHLYMEFGSITTLSALKDMTKLTTLTIDNCKISDITPIENLSGLNYLHLGSNDISDITSVAKLTKLKTLYLSNNNISDISPLANLSELYSLYLEMNSISDITPLAELTKLNNLVLGRNNISDITPLAKLTGIESLNLDSNNISELSPLENLLKLNYLNLFNNNFSDISPLAKLSELNSLNLGINNISDISPLASLTKLTKLYLDNISISDYSPLFDLPKLDTLSIIGASEEALNQIKQAMPNTQIKNK